MHIGAFRMRETIFALYVRLALARPDDERTMNGSVRFDEAKAYRRRRFGLLIHSFSLMTVVGISIKRTPTAEEALDA